MSSNEYISWDFIMSNLNKPWNWKELSRNKIVNFRIIQENSFLRWDWKSVSENPNITLDIIINNLDCKWDFPTLKRILSIEEYNNLSRLHIKYIFEKDEDEE